MTSLSEVYQGRARAAVGLRRFYLGVALFVLGAGAVVSGIVVATTDVAASTLALYQARELAGVLAGLGIPAVFLGVFAALPASGRTRAAAAIGASVAVFGVVLFWAVYPTRWIAAPDGSAALTLLTVLVYFAGVTTTGWSLFVAVATFKTRRDPGGTAQMTVTEEGQIRLVEQPQSSSSGLGGVGLFGFGTTDVETQNRPGTPDQQQSSKPPAASDGGATTDGPGDAGITDPGSPQRDSFTDAADLSGQPDRYCGNCTHFHYVDTDEGIKPYCDRYKEYLDDMDACEHWRQQ